MKATDLLEKQHRKLEDLFAQLESGLVEPTACLRELADALGAHMAIEQEIFYPAIRAVREDIVSESFEEHAIAELALKRLLSTPPADPSFLPKVAMLRTLLDVHVVEEEEDLFPAVESCVEPEQLLDLGRALAIAFREAVARGFEALVPQTMASTSADSASRSSQRAT